MNLLDLSPKNASRICEYYYRWMRFWASLLITVIGCQLNFLLPSLFVFPRITNQGCTGGRCVWEVCNVMCELCAFITPAESHGLSLSLTHTHVHRENTHRHPYICINPLGFKHEQCLNKLENTRCRGVSFLFYWSCCSSFMFACSNFEII